MHTAYLTKFEYRQLIRYKHDHFGCRRNYKRGRLLVGSKAYHARLLLRALEGVHDEVAYHFLVEALELTEEVVHDGLLGCKANAWKTTHARQCK